MLTVISDYISCNCHLGHSSVIAFVILPGVCKYAEFFLRVDSLEEAPTREDGGREVVNFRVVYKKETLSITFELDQPVSKLKSHMHELTGSVHG